MGVSPAFVVDDDKVAILEEDSRLALRVLRRKGVSSVGVLRFRGVDEMPMLPKGSRTLDLGDAEVDSEAGVFCWMVALVESIVFAFVFAAGVVAEKFEREEGAEVDSEPGAVCWMIALVESTVLVFVFAAGVVVGRLEREEFLVRGDGASC